MTRDDIKEAVFDALAAASDTIEVTADVNPTEAGGASFEVRLKVTVDKPMYLEMAAVSSREGRSIGRFLRRKIRLAFATCLRAPDDDRLEPRAPARA